MYVSVSQDLVRSSRGIAKGCAQCNKKFDTFTREHICKRCLKPVCSSCSADKLIIADYDLRPKEKHRVCRTCSFESKFQNQLISDNALEFGKTSQIAIKWLISFKIINESNVERDLAQIEQNYHAYNPRDLIQTIDLTKMKKLLSYSLKDFIFKVQLNDKDEDVSKKLVSVLNRLASMLDWKTLPNKFHITTLFFLTLASEAVAYILLLHLYQHLLPEYVIEFLNDPPAISESLLTSKQATKVHQIIVQLNLQDIDVKPVKQFIQYYGLELISSLNIDILCVQSFYFIIDALIMNRSFDEVEKHFKSLIMQHIKFIRVCPLPSKDNYQNVLLHLSRNTALIEMPPSLKSNPNIERSQTSHPTSAARPASQIIGQSSSSSSSSQSFLANSSPSTESPSVKRAQTSYLSDSHKSNQTTQQQNHNSHGHHHTHRHSHDAQSKRDHDATEQRQSSTSTESDVSDDEQNQFNHDSNEDDSRTEQQRTMTEPIGFQRNSNPPLQSLSTFVQPIRNPLANEPSNNSKSTKNQDSSATASQANNSKDVITSNSQSSHNSHHILELETIIHQLEAKNKGLQETLALKEHSLDDLHSEMKQKDANLTELQLVLKQNQQSLIALQQKEEQKQLEAQTHLSKLEAKVSSNESTIAEQKQSILEKDLRLIELHSLISSQQIDIDALNARITKLTEVNSKQIEEMERLKNEGNVNELLAQLWKDLHDLQRNLEESLAARNHESARAKREIDALTIEQQKEKKKFSQNMIDLEAHLIVAQNQIQDAKQDFTLRSAAFTREIEDLQREKVHLQEQVAESVLKVEKLSTQLKEKVRVIEEKDAEHEKLMSELNSECEQLCDQNQVLTTEHMRQTESAIARDTLIFEGLNKMNADLKKELQELKAKGVEVVSRNNVLENEMAQAKEQLASVQEELVGVKEESAYRNSEVERLREALAVSEQTREETAGKQENRISALKAELDALEKKHVEQVSQYEECTQQLSAKSAQFEEKLAAWNTSEAKCEELTRDSDAMKQNVKESSKTIHVLLEKISKLEEDLEKAGAEMTELKQNSAATLSGFEESVRNAEAQVKALAEANSEIEDLKQRLKVAEEKLAATQEELDKYLMVFQSVKKTVQEVQK